MNINRTVTDRDAYISAAIRGERNRLAAAIAGHRNQTLFRCASALASLGVREGTILEHLREPSDAIGLRPKEFFRTVKSAMKAGQARTRSFAFDYANHAPPLRLLQKEKPADSSANVRSPLPLRTHAGEGPAPQYREGNECPQMSQELRRHVYKRNGEPVRIKIKKADGSYSNWYRVQDRDRAGWQAAKPSGYVDCPYFAGSDPFDRRSRGRLIFWPEGEKDCDKLAALGELAFCFGGCGDGLPDFDSNILAGRDVVILADNDEAGRSHAERKAARILAVANSVRVIHFLDLPVRGDVADWLEAGNSIEDLRLRVEASPLWAATSPAEDPSRRFSWSEPDMSIIDDRRGDLPELPIDAVPAAWRIWLQRSAHGAGVTEAHVFVPLLGIGSSLVGTARRIQASRSWTEPMTMWTAIVGFSGTGKTPGIDVTKRALGEVQKLKSSAVAALERSHNSRREEAKVAKKRWTDSVEEAVTNGLPAPPMPENAADVPMFTPPRLFVSDATVERLAVMLQSRPSGALYIADELAGLFLNMGRYTGGSDKEFWLEAWNAKPYVVERMGRPAVNLEHLLIGVIGGLQPDKLQRSFGTDGDGMYARVLFAWPMEPKYRPLTNDVAEVEPEIVNALNRLVDISPLGKDLIIRTVPLSAEAVAEFEQFRQFLHRLKPGLDGREREWWAKGEAHVLRMAGTLTYLEWSRSHDAEPTEISVENMRRSIGLFRDYFWPHARASLRQIGLSEKHATERRVLRWIKANRLPGQEISATDIRREALSQSLDEAAVLDVIAQLEEACWLRPLSSEKTGAGRPRRRWEANPLLY